MWLCVLALILHCILYLSHYAVVSRPVSIPWKVLSNKTSTRPVLFNILSPAHNMVLDQYYLLLANGRMQMEACIKANEE